MELDVYKWYHSLRTLFRELITEMNTKEETELSAISVSLGNKVNNLVSQQSITGQMGIDPELYEALDIFEKKIRQIVKSSGLQNKMQDEAMSALK